MIPEQTDVVVVGHICLDVLPSFAPGSGSPADLFIPGKLTEVGPPVISTGGAVSNTGLALHRLGVSTRFVSKIGDDLLGRAVLDVLNGYGRDLADGMIMAPDEPTSYSVIINPQGVDRIIFHCPGANDTFHPSEVPPETLQDARVLHFGYPPLMRRTYEDGGTALAEFFRQARTLGTFVSVDMAQPDPDSPAGRVDWIAWLERVLPHVDFFGPSIDEILFMLGYRDKRLDAGNVDGDLLSEVSETLLRMGARIVALKLGEHGLYLRTGATLDLPDREEPSGLAETWRDREMLSPCFQVNVKGTTGAGDCTLAGFLAGLVRRLPPEETLATAVGVGACSVEVADAISGVPPLATVQNRIASGWKHHPVALDLNDWCTDTTSSLWYGPNDRVRYTPSISPR